MELLDQPLGQLARNLAGATRVFHEHKLDFCCGGKHSLRDAASAKGLDAQAIAAQLEGLKPTGTEGQDWGAVTPKILIDHILTRFHAVHREQLPELIRLALKVEHVHHDRPECPIGLADHLRAMQQELESHMQKEEQVLFPMLTSDHAAMDSSPITMMRTEHVQHGEAVQRISDLTHGITLPRGACNTWRALYLGLATFREDLMEHIHLENNILFETAARQSEPA